MAARIAELAPAGADALLAWNPEFLREGFAVQDTLKPDRIVIGVEDGRAEKQLRDFYAPMIDAGSPLVVTDYATAELVKVAANAFLATKISFINAMAEVCEATGADVVDLADALGHDARIGRRFLNAGIGFGGGCLPKDIRAFLHRAGELGVEDAMTLPAPHRRREPAPARACGRGRHGDGRRPARGRAHRGLGRGVQARQRRRPRQPGPLDRRAAPPQGCRRTRLRPAGRAAPRVPASRRSPTPTPRSTPASDADLVLHLTEWPEFRQIGPADLEGVVARPRLFDGRNVLDLDLWRSAGWKARALGRR